MWRIFVYKRHLNIGLIYVNMLNVYCLFNVPYKKLNKSKKMPVLYIYYELYKVWP